jgi:hypothetical protein
MTMTRLSEQLEREAEVARGNLAADLDELRHRMTPGQIVDEVADYARDTPVAEFARNLLRDLRENPLPLLLIGAGIGWSIFNSSRRPRIVVEARPPGAKNSALPAQWGPQPVAKRNEWEVAAVARAADS